MTEKTGVQYPPDCLGCGCRYIDHGEPGLACPEFDGGFSRVHRYRDTAVPVAESDNWTMPKGLFPGVMDYEREALVGGIIRRACEHDHDTMRMYLTCSVGELAQRVVLAMTAPRPVSPEAAPPENLLTRVLLAEAEAEEAEAAPPRATTPPERSLDVLRRVAMTQPDIGAARGYIEYLESELARLRAPLAAHPATTPACERCGAEFGLIREGGILRCVEGCALAGSPSRESGALLDAYGNACGELDEEVAYDGDVLSACDKVDYARAAVDLRLSTLERDAARMREALAGILALANSEAHAVAIHGDEYAFACTVGDRARAALAPSGEPTTTPETSDASE